MNSSCTVRKRLLIVCCMLFCARSVLQQVVHTYKLNQQRENSCSTCTCLQPHCPASPVRNVHQAQHTIKRVPICIYLHSGQSACRPSAWWELPRGDARPLSLRTTAEASERYVLSAAASRVFIVLPGCTQGFCSVSYHMHGDWRTCWQMQWAALSWGAPIFQPTLVAETTTRYSLQYSASGSGTSPTLPQR